MVWVSLSQSVILFKSQLVGGVVVSWLVSLSPKGVVRIRALAADTVLCSWTTLPVQRLSLLVTSCYRNQDKLSPDGPLNLPYLQLSNYSYSVLESLRFYHLSPLDCLYTIL